MRPFDRRSATYRSSTSLPLVLAAILVLAWLAVGSAGARTWTVIDSPGTGAPHGDLAGVACPSATSCMAVGWTYGENPDLTNPLVERYDGARGWTLETIRVPGRGHAQLRGVDCRSSQFCVAVGALDTRAGDTLPLIERWNGVAWRRQRTPRPFAEGSIDDAEFNAVTCPSARVCVAVGSDDVTGFPLVERWDGDRWRVQRSQTPNQAGGLLLAVSCGSKSDCTAVGTSADAGAEGCAAPLIERAEGMHWSLQRTPRLAACNELDDSGLNGVSCVAASPCFAVGQFDRSNRAHDHSLIERRRARTWSIRPTPAAVNLVDPWGGGVNLDGVSCLGRRACVAVGAAGSEVHLVPIAERWNGGRWKLEETAPQLRNGALLAIACPSRHDCIAVGANYGLQPGLDVPLIERLSR